MPGFLRIFFGKRGLSAKTEAIGDIVNYSGKRRPQVSQFAYDNAQGAVPNIWADLDASGSLTTRRIFGAGLDQPLARIEDTDIVAWYLTDHLGSIMAVTNSTGQLIDTVTYDAFGNIQSESSPLNGDRYKYVGMQFDIDGQYTTPDRRVNPQTGTWSQQDPVGVSGTNPNLYPYVGNNPTNATDASGMLATHFDDPNTGFKATIEAHGISSGFFGNYMNDKDSGEIGIYIAISSSETAKIKVFQVVRSEIQVVGGNGRKGYLDMRSRAKSDGKPSLLYVNPPSAPVWGLDAPSDRSTTYIRPSDTTKDYIGFSDSPGLKKYYESFSGTFLKHDVCSATFKAFFKTFVEYQGTLEVVINWEATAAWSNKGEWNTLVGPSPWAKPYTYSFYGYAIKNFAWATAGSDKFKELIGKKDTNGPTSVLDDQLKAITGK